MTGSQVLAFGGPGSEKFCIGDFAAWRLWLERDPVAWDDVWEHRVCIPSMQNGGAANLLRKDVPKNTGAGSALADGLYWYAEKLMWGYEGGETNQEVALRMFRQAAALGSSDALIRIGQSHEYGRWAPPDPQAALRSYVAAARAGNIVGLAFAAKLISRTSHLQKAEALWSRFFTALIAEPDAIFVAASRGELLHEYITVQLRLGLEPGHTRALFRHRLEIVGYHQHLLEHATEKRLSRLDATSEWIKLNLGPWPV